VIAFGRMELAGHEVPKVARFIDMLPNPTVGKIARREPCGQARAKGKAAGIHRNPWPGSRARRNGAAVPGRHPICQPVPEQPVTTAGASDRLRCKDARPVLL
jgi:hypothetical protein